MQHIKNKQRNIIKMVAFRHIGNFSIIVVKCMTLKDYMLATKRKGFLH